METKYLWRNIFIIILISSITWWLTLSSKFKVVIGGYVSPLIYKTNWLSVCSNENKEKCIFRKSILFISIFLFYSGLKLMIESLPNNDIFRRENIFSLKLLWSSLFLALSSVGFSYSYSLLRENFIWFPLNANVYYTFYSNTWLIPFINLSSLILLPLVVFFLLHTGNFLRLKLDNEYTRRILKFIKSILSTILIYIKASLLFTIEKIYIQITWLLGLITNWIKIRTHWNNKRNEEKLIIFEKSIFYSKIIKTVTSSLALVSAVMAFSKNKENSEWITYCTNRIGVASASTNILTNATSDFFLDIQKKKLEKLIKETARNIGISETNNNNNREAIEIDNLSSRSRSN